jgi:hypothetical protein
VPVVEFKVRGLCGFLNSKVNVADAVPEVEPVAVIVRLPDDMAVGVPEITPVEVSRVRPVGKVPAEIA